MIKERQREMVCRQKKKKSACSQPKSKKNNNKKTSELTVETGQGSSETATQEAAAVDYGSAACGRENIWSTSEFVCVYVCVPLSV